MFFPDVLPLRWGALFDSGVNSGFVTKEKANPFGLAKEFISFVYTHPWATIASATFRKPAMLAPVT